MPMAACEVVFRQKARATQDLSDTLPRSSLPPLLLPGGLVKALPRDTQMVGPKRVQ